MESQLSDATMAIELIKQYGFNPKEYNDFMAALKTNNWKEQEKVLLE